MNAILLPVLSLAQCYWALSQISPSVGASVEPASQNITKVDFLRAVTAILPSMYLDFTANWKVISSPLVTFPISLSSLWFLSRSYGKYLREEKKYYVTEPLVQFFFKIIVSCYNAPTALVSTAANVHSFSCQQGCCDICCENIVHGC